MRWIGKNVSAREFAFWRGVYIKRPFDDEGAFHLPIAILSAMTANMNRKSGTPAHKVHEFLPFHEAPEVDLEHELMNGDW